MDQHPWHPICSPPADLVTPVPVCPDGHGGPTRSQARSRRWRRTAHGLYVPADTDSARVEQRILEAYAAAPDYAVVAGWAACRLRGAAFHDGLGAGLEPLAVPLSVGPRGWSRAPAGARLCRARMDADDAGLVAGMRVASGVRATFDVMRWATGVRGAVIEAEKALSGQITTRHALRAYADAARGSHGRRQVQEALDLVRDGARSPAEVRLRLIAELDAGFPPLLVNAVVVGTDGLRVAEVDLLDVEAGLVIEYDGRDHRSATRQSWDATKDHELRQLGLEVLRVTSQHVGSPTLVVRLAQARERALVSGAPRRWGLLRRTAA